MKSLSNQNDQQKVNLNGRLENNRSSWRWNSKFEAIKLFACWISWKNEIIVYRITQTERKKTSSTRKYYCRMPMN